MRFTLAFALALALPLAACGEMPPASDEAAAEPAAVESPIPVETDGGIGDGAEPLPEAESPSDESVAGDVIPARYLGVWDYEGGSCSPESDLRMEISAKEILFYESIGTVTAITEEDGDTVVTLDMEGEGETWTQKTRLSLSGEGDDERLATTDGEQPKEADEYPSKRCPA